MIEIKNITKVFGEVKALNNVSFSVNEGSVFGLVGSNGAGKSTLLRLLSGVYKADGGEILLDGRKVFENTGAKADVIFISDFPYFFAQTNIESMAKYYKDIYPNWSDKKFEKFREVFPLDFKKRISTMSKGMQRQAAIILGLSAMPKYILFDEIFDGLDPVIRELVKKILVEYIDESNATVIIASHNLRELENICDHIGLLHKGGILYEDEIDAAKLGVCKVQLIVENPEDFEKIKDSLQIIKVDTVGKMISFTARGSQESVIEKVNEINPVFSEVLPLTLEELFISEMEVAGYDIDKFFE